MLHVKKKSRKFRTPFPNPDHRSLPPVSRFRASSHMFSSVLDPPRLQLCGACIRGHDSCCFYHKLPKPWMFPSVRNSHRYLNLGRRTPFKALLGLYTSEQNTFASTLRSTSCSHSLLITRRHAAISCLLRLHHRCNRASCTCAWATR